MPFVKSLRLILHFRRVTRYWSTPRYLTYTQSVLTKSFTLHRYRVNLIQIPLPPTFANCNAAGLFSSFIDDPFSTSVNGNDCQVANIISGRWLQIPDRRGGVWGQRRGKHLPLMVIGHVISNAAAKSNGNDEERKCRRMRGMKCWRLWEWYEKETFSTSRILSYATCRRGFSMKATLDFSNNMW